ncbi:hypothetical protein D3C76_1033860 [compost metagenome]
MGQGAQAEGGDTGDQHGQAGAKQRAAKEGGRPAEECAVEVTAQTAADQPLPDLAGAMGQADVQVPTDTERGTDQQGAEQPGVGLLEALPGIGEQCPQGEDQGQPAPVNAACALYCNAVPQQVFEDGRYTQDHDQHPQALPGCDQAEACAVACAEVDHLARTTRHAREERGGAVFAGAAQQPDTDHAGEAGNQRTEENQAEMAEHLLHHLRCEMQADTDADNPLPAFAPTGNLAQLPGRQATYQDDGQQRADHPGQWPADLAGEKTAGQAHQGCTPPQFEGAVRHRPGHVAGRCACARCAAAAPVA